MYAGSGADALPWYFRDAKLGPLVGTRTWAGWWNLRLPEPDGWRRCDGSARGFLQSERRLEVENHGVAPDYEVEQTPKTG